jgi:hypothetical protein
MEKTMNKMCCALLVNVQGSDKNRATRIMGTDAPSFTTNSETGADQIIGILGGRGGDVWIESGEGHDIIFTGDRKDVAYGGTGDDVIFYDGGRTCPAVFRGLGRKVNASTSVATCAYSTRARGLFCCANRCSKAKLQCIRRRKPRAVHGCEKSVA